MKLDLDLNTLSIDELELVLALVKRQRKEVQIGKSIAKTRKHKFSKRHMWTVDEIETVIRESRNGATNGAIAKLLDVRTKSVNLLLERIRAGRQLSNKMRTAIQNTSPKGSLGRPAGSVRFL